MTTTLGLIVEDDVLASTLLTKLADCEADINITAMTIARQQKGGKVLSVITIDSPVETDLLDQMREEIQADTMRAVSMIEQH